MDLIRLPCGNGRIIQSQERSEHRAKKNSDQFMDARVNMMSVAVKRMVKKTLRGTNIQKP